MIAAEATRQLLFQSTLPMKGATGLRAAQTVYLRLFQSTLPMKGATCGYWRRDDIYNVSIHAPNEGSDEAELSVRMYGGVSIHAPNEGSDGGLGCDGED